MMIEAQELAREYVQGFQQPDLGDVRPCNPAGEPRFQPLLGSAGEGIAPEDEENLVHEQ